MRGTHLTEQEIAKAAEALCDNNYSSLDKEMKDHLKSCDTCFEEVTQLTAILRDTPINGTRKQLPSYKTMLTIAALATIILCSTYIISRHKVNKIEASMAHFEKRHAIKGETIASQNNKENTSIYQEPLNDIIQNDDIMAYAQNEKLEQLCKRFDNSALRGKSIEIISSKPILSKAGRVDISLINEDNQNLILELFNNKAEKISEYETRNNNFHPEINTNGRYYWKLLNDDFYLIYCGVIEIR